MTTEAACIYDPVTGGYYYTRTSDEQHALNNQIPVASPWYTTHGGEPITVEEWADHNYGVGRFYANHGIQIEELETDWPEVFADPDCMRGFREDMQLDLGPPAGGWPHKGEWPVDELTGQPIPPWRKT